jgi:hypothetical protein
MIFVPLSIGKCIFACWFDALCLIWPPVHPLNLTYILRFLLPLPWANLSSNIPNTKSRNHFLSPRSFIYRIHPGPRLLQHFHNKLIFYREDLLAPRPTPKLEDHPFSAVHNCLLNIIATFPHTWGASPASTTWGHAMPWWQGIHLIWSRERYYFKKWFICNYRMEWNVNWRLISCPKTYKK